MDSEHKAWFFIDAASKDEALIGVLTAYRRDTKISQLNKFRSEDVNELPEHHEG
jgi:hypothetical protein